MDRIAPVVDWHSKLPNLFRLDGKVVFMPGGYGGIGEAVGWAPLVPVLASRPLSEYPTTTSSASAASAASAPKTIGRVLGL